MVLNWRDDEEVIHHLLNALEDIGRALQSNSPDTAFELVEDELGRWCRKCNMFGCESCGRN